MGEAEAEMIPEDMKALIAQLDAVADRKKAENAVSAILDLEELKKKVGQFSTEKLAENKLLTNIAAGKELAKNVKGNDQQQLPPDDRDEGTRHAVVAQERSGAAANVGSRALEEAIGAQGVEGLRATIPPREPRGGSNAGPPQASGVAQGRTEGTDPIREGSGSAAPEAESAQDARTRAESTARDVLRGTTASYVGAAVDLARYILGQNK